MPSKLSWMACQLAENKNISITKAIEKLYSSQLYQALETESAKLWHWGPNALYEEFEEELNK
ncbi:MAG: hypothetical protein Q4F47_00755 [Bacteroidaceae bacterium]|nr:hypothetical protein [Bacteroidaceae bacterium]